MVTEDRVQKPNLEDATTAVKILLDFMNSEESGLLCYHGGMHTDLFHQIKQDLNKLEFSLSLTSYKMKDKE